MSLIDGIILVKFLDLIRMLISVHESSVNCSLSRITDRIPFLMSVIIPDFLSFLFFSFPLPTRKYSTTHTSSMRPHDPAVILGRFSLITSYDGANILNVHS